MARKLIASHADIDDEGQDVAYPEIGTTATDGVDGDQTVVSSSDSVIVGTVEYVGLTPGVEYVMVGALYDHRSR